MTTEAADAWKMWTQTEVDTILMVVSEGVRDPDVFLAEMQKRTGVDRSPAAYVHRMRVLKDSGHMIPLELVSALQRSAKDRSNGSSGTNSGDHQHRFARWSEAEHAAFVSILSGSIGKSGEAIMDECRQAGVNRTASSMRNRIDIMKKTADHGGVHLNTIQHARRELGRIEVSDMAKKGTLGAKPRKTGKTLASSKTSKRQGRVVPAPQAGSMFTPDQAAKRYRCSPGLLRKLATRGLVKRLAIGAYDATSVHRYFETHARWPLAKDRVKPQASSKPSKPAGARPQAAGSTILPGDRCSIDAAVKVSGLSMAMVRKLGQWGVVRKARRNDGTNGNWYSRRDLERYSKMSLVEKRTASVGRRPSRSKVTKATARPTSPVLADWGPTRPAKPRSQQSEAERNAVAGAQMEATVAKLAASVGIDGSRGKSNGPWVALAKIKWVLDGKESGLLSLLDAFRMIRGVVDAPQLVLGMKQAIENA